MPEMEWTMSKEVVKGICLFGCGKLGRDMLRVWSYLEKQPEYMCDNNPELWGTTLDGVQVVSPSELTSSKPERIIITSSANKEIKEQLLSAGISNDRIFAPEYLYDANALSVLSDCLYVPRPMWSGEDRDKQTCLIDLNNGMVLGGVERWSYQFAKMARELGYDGQYLILPTGSR